MPFEPTKKQWDDFIRELEIIALVTVGTPVLIFVAVLVSLTAC